ncbi:immunity 49 family protein [Limibacter armeniacum]|uniref:immunity 49 family protein n=1 Tax=Limibacter armeniacum TaxID=466084 RepID=UPI002FE5A834
MTRYRKGVDQLNEMPLELHKNSVIHEDAISLVMVKLLREMLSHDMSGQFALLQEAKQTIKEHIGEMDKFREEYILWNDLPLLNVYAMIFGRDEEGYNKELAEALELHKEYWSQEVTHDNGHVELRHRDWKGWIAWRLVAAACIARSNGLMTKIQTPYLPEWLLAGDFEGLPTTVEVE